MLKCLFLISKVASVHVTAITSLPKEGFCTGERKIHKKAFSTERKDWSKTGGAANHTPTRCKYTNTKNIKQKQSSLQKQCVSTKFNRIAKKTTYVQLIIKKSACLFSISVLGNFFVIYFWHLYNFFVKNYLKSLDTWPMWKLLY